MIKIKVNNLDVEGILFSGACFRMTKESDGSITNILKDRVVNIKQDGNVLTIISNNYNNLESIINEYFDLNRDYELINKELINNNKDLEDTINSCKNYRILNQDSFEMGISYIISQNNNVKRISKIINDISECYGTKIVFNNKDYYLFPTYEALKNIKLEDLSRFKLGFRDKYIIDYLKKYETLKDIDDLDTSSALDKLMSIKGIGLKVASCILLFGYKRLDVFPIDTWVKQYMTKNYNLKNDIKLIKEYSYNHYHPYEGLVIQYMFHKERNVNK